MIKYINSQNKEFNLKGTILRLKEANFHKVEWKYNGISKQYGIDIQDFEKDPIILELQFVLKGSKAERKALLEELHSAMEIDKINKKVGRIVWGSCYVSGYFINSNTFPSGKENETINEATFVAPHPFWIDEQTINVGVKSDTQLISGEANEKVYPYTYPYVYPSLQNETNVFIDHYTDSHFKLIVYGPTLSVLINIAGYPYQVEYPIEAGEYMIIDSRPSTPKEEKLCIVRTNGVKENIFQYRSVENSVFKKIPPGMVEIDYPRTYGIDLTVFKERSEPSWK